MKVNGKYLCLDLGKDNEKWRKNLWKFV